MTPTTYLLVLIVVALWAIVGTLLRIVGTLGRLAERRDEATPTKV